MPEQLIFHSKSEFDSPPNNLNAVDRYFGRVTVVQHLNPFFSEKNNNNNNDQFEEKKIYRRAPVKLPEFLDLPEFVS